MSAIPPDLHAEALLLLRYVAACPLHRDMPQLQEMIGRYADLVREMPRLRCSTLYQRLPWLLSIHDRPKTALRARAEMAFYVYESSAVGAGQLLSVPGRRVWLRIGWSGLQTLVAMIASRGLGRILSSTIRFT